MHQTVVMGSVRRSVKPEGSGNDKTQLLGREGRACHLGRCESRRKCRSPTWSLSLCASMGMILRMGSSTTGTRGLLGIRQPCSMSQSAPSRNRPET